MSSHNSNTWNDNDNASGVPPPNPTVESTEHEYDAQTHHRQIITRDEVYNARTTRNNLITNMSYNMDNEGLLDSIVTSSSWTNRGTASTTSYNWYNDMQRLVNRMINNDFGCTSSNANNNIIDRGSSGTNNNNVASNNGNNAMDPRWNSRFPPGYRFCPLDGELIEYYLKRKIENRRLLHDRIKDVQLYRTTPQQLCEENEAVGDKEWYFFTPRDRKYKNGSRPDRAAGSGYWKATGADKEVFHPLITNHLIGQKKTLVFYDGIPRQAVKTNWIMHEYRIEKVSTRKRLHDTDMKLDDWVLCRIYNKSDKPRGNNSKVRRGNEDEAEIEAAEDAELPPQNMIEDLDDIDWMLNDDGDEDTLDPFNGLSDFDFANLD